MLLGRHDGLTPASIADSWLKQVRAPAKVGYWFENSAHMPMIEEPGRLLEALLDIRSIAIRPRSQNSRPEP
ncbi:MAG TPA: alpha/beta hydrolase, partial [Sphingomonas sp.]|nr:alpha/beta hydrolase [Sphingomonas sp.]